MSSCKNWKYIFDFWHKINSCKNLVLLVFIFDIVHNLLLTQIFRFAWLYLAIGFPREIVQNYSWLSTLFKFSPASYNTRLFSKCHVHTYPPFYASYCLSLSKMLSPHILAINCIILGLLRFKDKCGSFSKDKYLFEQTACRKNLNKHSVSFMRPHPTSTRKKLQHFNKR